MLIILVIIRYSRCPRFGTLPSNCHLGSDPNDRCCQKVVCDPTGPAKCADTRADCASFGDYSCHEPYLGWARDNCAQFCGLCGGGTGTGTGTYCFNHMYTYPDRTYPDYSLIWTPVWEPISIPHQKMTNLSGQ